MINLYIRGKRVASVAGWAMCRAVAAHALAGERLVTVREGGKVRGHFRYGHWEPRE